MSDAPTVTPPASPSTAGGSDGLGRTAAGGAAWQGMSYLLGRALVFAATVLLARLLAPEQFGLVGLALVFIGYAEAVASLGVAQAIVYLPAGRRTNDAAVAFSVASSLLLAAVAVLSAPAVASFFGDPEVAPLFRLLALTLVLGAAAQVPDALLQRDLRFRRRVGAQLTRSFGRGVASVAFALAGLGPYAIAWGYIVGDLLYVVVAWRLVDYRPSRSIFGLRWQEAKPLVSYGAPAAASVLLSNLIFDIDYLVVGQRLGAEALGLYTLAFRVPYMAIISVFFVFSAVAFPVFSKVNDDVERLRRGYLTGLSIQATYGFAAGLGLAVMAPELVEVVLGPEWRESIVPLQALSIYAALRSLAVGANDIYKAMGRPALALWLSFLRLALVVPVLLVATRWGIEGVAWAQVVLALVFVGLMQGLALRILGLPVRRLARALQPALVVGASVALAAGTASLWSPGSPSVRLAVQAAAGGLAGAAALRFAAPVMIDEVRSLIGRKATAPA